MTMTEESFRTRIRKAADILSPFIDKDGRLNATRLSRHIERLERLWGAVPCDIREAIEKEQPTEY